MTNQNFLSWFKSQLQKVKQDLPMTQQQILEDLTNMNPFQVKSVLENLAKEAPSQELEWLKSLTEPKKTFDLKTRL